MTNYRMNFATRTLTISKNFEHKAINNPNSEEWHILNNCRSLCPDLNIAYFSRRNSNSKQYGGMTYEKMENYIKLYENSEELLKMFELVKEVAKIQKCKMKFVYNWFVEQFPNYEAMPEIKNGKLYTPVFRIMKPEEEKAEKALLAA